MAIFQTVMMAYMKRLWEKQSKEMVISGFLILSNMKKKNAIADFFLIIEKEGSALVANTANMYSF
jgi:hypothetical protein